MVNSGVFTSNKTNRMVQKMLVFLCMLTGWSQAFPYHNVATEEVMKDTDKLERERRDVILSSTDFTPPVCRVVNESLDCSLSSGDATWEVIYIMTDGDGSGIDYPSFSVSTDSCEGNTTYFIEILNVTVDENGYNATTVKYSAPCCFQNVEISVVDKAGNKANCPLNIKRPVTTISPMTVSPTSSSFTTTVSLWSSLILMALKAMLL
ncbi:hypothetical protein Q8A67_013625 [Cirrhinus molitorella]|uniref:Uncharacterized protein n=1 Tax=Cirrhinus molitorella TaxID=172907 RepID=A0AA88TNL3_9TELE|nr:hypothetical protein Q8A67_013625 [Cirrhinus molitorella]